MCLYIYIHIYIDICVCLCVYSWMGGQKEYLISCIFEAAPEYPEDVSLSILARRAHEEQCTRKLSSPEEKAKDVSQSGAENQSV